MEGTSKEGGGREDEEEEEEAELLPLLDRGDEGSCCREGVYLGVELLEEGEEEAKSGNEESLKSECERRERGRARGTVSGNAQIVTRC